MFPFNLKDPAHLYKYSVLPLYLQIVRNLMQMVYFTKKLQIVYVVFIFFFYIPSEYPIAYSRFDNWSKHSLILFTKIRENILSKVNFYFNKLKILYYFNKSISCPNPRNLCIVLPEMTHST